jgi:hypothetical protein
MGTLRLERGLQGRLWNPQFLPSRTPQQAQHPQESQWAHSHMYSIRLRDNSEGCSTLTLSSHRKPLGNERGLPFLEHTPVQYCPA